MKKYIFLFVILTMVFSSCEKEEPNKDEPKYPEGSVFGPTGPTIIIDVTNPVTGKTWMDRNLGATQAATSSTDEASYGDLYQWGRRADGHQLRNSATTDILSSIDQPAHGSFITIRSGNFDWRSPQNNNLWQGVNGVNNPCPSGYRIPTEAEWVEERLSWDSNNASGALSSPLQLPLAGNRDNFSAALVNFGVGLYWGSMVSSTDSRSLVFFSGGASTPTGDRAGGRSVRCIKD